MPLYEYACQDCGHRFEVRQGIRDEPLTTCPTCGGSIRRVVQPVGIVFKGSGFYKTDSRNSTAASVPAGGRKSEGSTTTEGGATAAGSNDSPTPPASGTSAGAASTPASSA